MAKKKAAKERKLISKWIVRDVNGAYHVIVSNKKPRLLDSDMRPWRTMQKGDWVVGSGVAAIWGLALCTSEYEASTRTFLHLEPGKGPLKVELVPA